MKTTLTAFFLIVTPCCVIGSESSDPVSQIDSNNQTDFKKILLGGIVGAIGGLTASWLIFGR